MAVADGGLVGVVAPDRVRLLGVGIDPVTLQEAADRVESFIAAGRPHQVATPNPEIIYAAQSDPELRQVLEAADLVTADGTGVVWAAARVGQPVPERVTGIELAEELLRRAAARGYGVYFLGAQPGVAEEAAQRLNQKYEGLRVAGVQHGYFSFAEEPAIIDAVRRAGPDLLLAGLGSPKQEKWLAAHRVDLGVPVAIGLGGCFDVWAGQVRRAPLLFRRLHLEWLYRLGREPRRFWRMLALPKFVLAVRRYGSSPMRGAAGAGSIRPGVNEEASKPRE